MSPYSSSSCVVYPPGVKSIRAKTASSFPGLLPQNKSSLSGIVLHNSCPLFLSILSDLLWLFVALVTILPAGPLIHSQTLTRQWSTRVVNTKLGLTRGFLFLPRGGHEGVEVFLGIPYASAPLGSLRLMPPVSGAPWTGIKMNEQYPPVCPQVMPSGLHNFGGLSTSTISEESGGHKSSGGGGKGNLTAEEEEALKWMPRGRLAQLRRLFPFLTNQSEDCLYLSVYVPLSGKYKLEFLFVMLFPLLLSPFSKWLEQNTNQVCHIPTTAIALVTKKDRKKKQKMASFTFTTCVLFRLLRYFFLSQTYLIVTQVNPNCAICSNKGNFFCFFWRNKKKTR